MAIVKRSVKGSALTHAELDGNFDDLDGRLNLAALAIDAAYSTGSEVGAALDTLLGGTAWRGGTMTGTQIADALDASIGTTWRSASGGSTTIINDLTTGGTTAALSAQQGVVLNSAVNSKANTASPTFTGIPAAPTATAGTNTTQIATTAFVASAVAALVNASPAALDTLNELAVALGNDANFATTVNNSIALKANLASPTFTGTPAAPTATAGTNTTQLATTAFVNTAIVGKADIATVTEQVTAATYTLVQADNGKQKIFTNAGAIAVTVPAGLTNFGALLTKGNGAGNITITGSGATVRTSAGTGPHVVQTANASVTLLPTNTANEYTLAGPVGAGSTVPDIASQAEAEAGTENTKFMTALRVAQAIDARAGAGGQTRFPHGSTAYGGSDFLSSQAAGLMPYSAIAVNGGSIGEPVPLGATYTLDNRFGVVRVNSTTTANSGAIMRAGTHRLGVNDWHEGAFCPTTVLLSDAQGVSGLCNAGSAAEPTLGIYVWMVNGVMRGRLRNAGGFVETTGTVTATLTNWYYTYTEFTSTTAGRILIIDGVTNATLLDETITLSSGTIPSGTNQEVYSCLGLWDAALVADTAGLLDFAYYGTKRALPGRVFQQS